MNNGKSLRRNFSFSNFLPYINIEVNSKKISGSDINLPNVNKRIEDNNPININKNNYNIINPKKFRSDKNNKFNFFINTNTLENKRKSIILSNSNNKTCDENNKTKDNTVNILSKLNNETIVNTKNVDSPTNILFDTSNNDHNNNNKNSIKISKSSLSLFSSLLQKYPDAVNISPKKRKKLMIKSPSKTIYKTSENKLDSFLKLSRNKKITAREILSHYLNDNYTHVNCQTIKKKHGQNFWFPKLEQLYKSDKKLQYKLDEIKQNSSIAYKDDFNIKEYQATLINLIRGKCSQKGLNILEKRYKNFNEKIFGYLVPKGKYINLAYKLKDHLSYESFQKLKKMDRNYELYFGKNKVDTIAERREYFRKKIFKNLKVVK